MLPCKSIRAPMIKKHLLKKFIHFSGQLHHRQRFSSRPSAIRKNVPDHHSINSDPLSIGKFCSIACGTKFLFSSVSHTLNFLFCYPFPLLYEE